MSVTILFVCFEFHIMTVIDELLYVNLGLMPSRDLPDRFQFLFRALPKIIEVNVKDAQSHRRLTGAPVAVTYYDHETDGHRTLNSITDGKGRAFVELDGCVGT